MHFAHARRYVFTVCMVVATVSLAVGIGCHLTNPFFQYDAEQYLNIARENISHVAQPYASRQMGALLVRAIAKVTHRSVERAFVSEGIVALVVVSTVVYRFAFKAASPIWMLAAVAVLPLWPRYYENLATPDVWYAALLACTISALDRKWYIAASCMMFPLMLSRESTILTLMCFLVAGWRLLPRIATMLAIGLTVSASVIVHHLTLDAAPNAEHLPQALYLFAKVPWNVLRNLFGVLPWGNVLSTYCTQPVWSVSVHLAGIQAIGTCGMEPGPVVFCLGSAMTMFGSLPLLLFVLWRHGLLHQDWSFALRFSLIFGVTSFLVAPALGSSVDRLFGYGWPALLIGLPAALSFLERQGIVQSNGQSSLFLLLHGALCGLNYVEPSWAAIAIGIALCGCSYAVIMNMVPRRPTASIEAPVSVPHG